MAICNIIEDTNRTDEQHELINKQVRSSGPVPPEGCRLIDKPELACEKP